MLVYETFADEASFSFLQRLSLFNVFFGDTVVGTLARFCQGLEMLVLDSCTGESQVLELSKFPKLKIAILIGQEQALRWFECVDIVGTNLECFTCVASNGCHINADACAGIREITLVDCSVNQPDLFNDLTATFPLIEQVKVEIDGTDALKAVSNVLRKLKFENLSLNCVEDVHIDCPNLTLLDFSINGMKNLYVDCPNLRVFRYQGSTVPERLFFSPVADLEESSFKIFMNYAYDTLWLINLREFLELVMASPTYVDLSFNLPKATFEPEQVEAFHASPRYNVHLTLSVASEAGQNAAALVDAVLYIIRPTTLIVGSRFDLLKYLCDSLIKKSQGNICDEQVTTPCWLHQLEDFQVKSSTDTLDITKENLLDLPKQCPTFTKDIRFKFLWS